MIYIGIFLLIVVSLCVAAGIGWLLGQYDQEKKHQAAREREHVLVTITKPTKPTAPQRAEPDGFGPL